MPLSAKVELEKISESLENHEDDDSAKSSSELNFAMNNGRDFSTLFYDDDEFNPREAFHDNFPAGYKREADHR